MLYQLVKNNSKITQVYHTLDEVKQAIELMGLQFREVSYYGGFPVYTDKKNKVWSVQGLAENFNIVCSIPHDQVLSLQN